MDSSQNNPFGSFSSGGVGPGGFSSSPVMSASDDIVLASPQNNKSKQKMIIIGVAVLAVLALAGFVLWLINGRGVNISGSDKESFYRYANYVLYEIDSTEALQGEFNEDTYYAIDGLDEMSESKRKAFLLTAESYLDEFEENLGNVRDNTFLDEFSQYKEDFLLTKMLNTSSTLSDAEFINQYFSLDENSLDKWIDKRFSDYTESSYQSVKEFGKKGVEYYEFYADLLDSLREEGCISAANEFLECEDSDNAESEGELFDLRYELDEIQSMASQHLIEGCFTISQMLNGKYDKGEESK